MGDIAPKLAELTDNVLFGDVWERPGLAKRDRSLVTISALIAMNRPDQLRSHLALARQNGVTETEIVEAITHLAFYAGWPNAVSAVASVPAVRTQLIAQQRQIIAATLAAGSGIVAEGRDIGTVVAPEAPVKVYLTASAAVRALRRSAELADGPPVSAAQTEADQARRDQRDAAQSAMAGDAVEIDSTGLSLAEVVARIVALATADAGAVWTA